MWAFLGAFLYDVDGVLSGCPKPGYLGPNDRLQGFAILEKLNANIHVHILISCRTPFDRFWTALRLFSLLDTVPKRKYPDDAKWQRETWDTLVDRNWLGDPARTRTFAPLLHRYAPGGTAMVQVPVEIHGRNRVFGYLAKELGRSSLALATESDYWRKRADLHIRELKEFHSELGYTTPASRIRKDPITGAQTLNLDDPNPWKRKGKRVR
jgi:hypothetical protein